MYSRSAFQESNEPYRIPDNYRGNAFHGGNTSPALPVAGEEHETSLPPPTEQETKATSSDEHTKAEKAPKKPTASLLSTLLPPKPKGLHATGGNGILGDIGTEELLIIGIILLLSQNDSDDDILLLLLLLLFYK